MKPLGDIYADAGHTDAPQISSVVESQPHIMQHSQQQPARSESPFQSVDISRIQANNSVNHNQSELDQDASNNSFLSPHGDESVVNHAPSGNNHWNSDPQQGGNNSDCIEVFHQDDLSKSSSPDQGHADEGLLEDCNFDMSEVQQGQQTHGNIGSVDGPHQV